MRDDQQIEQMKLDRRVGVMSIAAKAVTSMDETGDYGLVFRDINKLYNSMIKEIESDEASHS